MSTPKRRLSKSPPPKSPGAATRKVATPPPRKSAGGISPSRPPGASPGRVSRRGSYNGPSAAQRCQKLRTIMAPSETHPYGRSSNSLSVELDVHLNVFIQFLNSGGCPDKMDPKTGIYSSSHLKRLVEWIDGQPEPVSAHARARKTPINTEAVAGRCCRQCARAPRAAPAHILPCALPPSPPLSPLRSWV